MRTDALRDANGATVALPSHGLEPVIPNRLQKRPLSRRRLIARLIG